MADGKILSGTNISGVTGSIIDDAPSLTGVLLNTILRGLSNYEIAVKNGFEGTETEYLQSLLPVIEVVEETDSTYILKFTIGEETFTTPNLRTSVDFVTDTVDEYLSEHDEAINENIANKTSWVDF